MDDITQTERHHHMAYWELHLAYGQALAAWNADPTPSHARTATLESAGRAAAARYHMMVLIAAAVKAHAAVACEPPVGGLIETNTMYAARRALGHDVADAEQLAELIIARPECFRYCSAESVLTALS